MKNNLMQYFRCVVVIALFVSISVPKQLVAQTEDAVSISSVSLSGEAKPGAEVDAIIKLSIDRSWHINSNKPNDEYLIASKLSLKADRGIHLKSVSYPKSKEIRFEFSDNPVSVFEGNVEVKARVFISENIKAGIYKLKFIFNYQACNNSTCQAPSSVESMASINIKTDSKSQEASTIQAEPVNNDTVSGAAEKGLTKVPDTSVTSGSGDDITNAFDSKGLLLTIIIVFLGGLALNLTPCVYPLIPITIGYFGGQSEGRTSRLFLLGILYVLGMALTYSVIGVITAMSGAMFGTLMQNTFVLLGIAAVLIALSLSMFGLYEFKMPDKLVEKAGGARTGVLGAFFMGLTMGIVAAPCIGPFVLGLVTYVGAKADPVLGFLLFFSLAVGLGLPYLLLALFSGKIKSLPRAGFWMEAVKHIFGFILLGMALYFLTPIIPFSIRGYVLPVFMIFSAFYLALIDKSGSEARGFRIFKYVFSILILALSAYMLVPENKESGSWEVYNQESVSNIDGQPYIIDFYADWCIPCKELDKITFSDKSVKNELKRFRTFKVDMTSSLSEEKKFLSRKFIVKGMPTIIIMNSKGEESGRITGFISPEKFLKIIKKVN